MTFLFSRACPSNDEGLELLARAGARVGLVLEVEQHEVTSDEEAERLEFRGSPSYLLGGSDLFPGDPEMPFRCDACRAYPRAGGRMGPLPPMEDLTEALRAATGGAPEGAERAA